ncbi:hypothetical protein EJB05_53682, partial [Eragrostis curvula]
MASKNPKLTHELGAQDLNLAFPHHHHHGAMQAHPGGEFAAFPSLESSTVCHNSNNNPMATSNGGRGGALSAMELLRSTGCYMPLPGMPPMQMHGDYAAAAAGFSFGEFRAAHPPPPSQSVLGFSLDAHGPAASGAAAGYGSGNAGLQGVPENASRLLFPFEDLKPPVNSGNNGDGAGGASDGAGGASGGAGDGNGGGHHHHQFEHGKEQGGGAGQQHDTPAGFWNGMIGGSGASW